MAQQPASFDLHLYRGADYIRTWRVTDSDGNAIDLSGYQFLAQANQDSIAGEAMLTGAQGNPTSGEILVSGSAGGELSLLIKQADIDAIEETITAGYWAMNAYDGDYINPWMEGRVVIHASPLFSPPT